MPAVRRFKTCLFLAVALGAAACAAAWAFRPADPGERFRDGLHALRQGDLNAAAKAARALAGEPGFESHARLLRGGVLLRTGDREQALAAFAQVVPEGELRVTAMLLTAECLYFLGRFAEAELVARKLVAEHPDNADAHRWLGAIYYDLGANTQAVAALERLAELEPDDFACHRLLGLMHLDFEEHARAAEHFRKALERSPPPEIRNELHENLAKALIADRNYTEALEALEPAEPTPQVLALRSECQWSLNQPERAERLLDQARREAPDARFVLLLEARMRLADGRPAAAVGPLKRALEIDRHDAEARYQLAQAYRQLGQPDDYERELAQWKVSKELREKLTELSFQAIERPSDGQLREQLAEVCDALGKHKLAQAWRLAAGAYRARPSEGNSSGLDWMRPFHQNPTVR